MTTKIGINILKNYTLFRESCLNIYFCRAFKIILILWGIGKYAANKTHNFWSFPEFIADTNHRNNVLHVSFISVAVFFSNQPQKQIFESVCLVLIKTKYDVKHWKRDLQWHKPMPAASAGFFLIVISRIDWLYFYQQTQEKSRMNVDSKYGEKRPITSLPAAFFSLLVFHLHSLEFPPKSVKYSFSLVIVF